MVCDILPCLYLNRLIQENVEVLTVIAKSVDLIKPIYKSYQIHDVVNSR